MESSSFRQVSMIFDFSFTTPRAPDIAARLRGVAGLPIWSFIPFPVPLSLLRRHISTIIDERFAAAGGGGMMARMLTQVPLPLLPHDAAEIAPGVGVVSGPDGSGVVWVHGLATFAWDAGDEAARRLAAVQLVQLNAATQVQVAQAFGVIPVSVWRWAKALAGGGVAGLVPAARGPQRASKLTPKVIAQIRELDRQGAGKAAIAAATGVSESSVRNVLRPACPAGDGIPAGQDPAGTSGSTDTGSAGTEPAGMDAGVAEPEVLPVLPDPVPRDGERALARFGLLGEGAAPAFTPGARYPLAGLLLALPPLAQSGLLDCARQVYGRLRNGFYGLEVMLIVLVFMALLREARAEGATGSPRTRWAGCSAWTGPRKSRRSAASSPSSPPPARPRTCSWRWPATTPRPGRTPWGSSTSTGTPAPTSASGTSRRCT